VNGVGKDRVLRREHDVAEEWYLGVDRDRAVDRCDHRLLDLEQVHGETLAV